MDRMFVKHRLLDKGMTLAELSRAASIPYDRLVKILGRYRNSRPEELRAIAAVLGLREEQLRGSAPRPGPRLGRAVGYGRLEER